MGNDKLAQKTQDRSNEIITTESYEPFFDTLRRKQKEYDGLGPTVGMRYGGQHKYVTWKFDASIHRHLEILHITDIQYGHIYFQKKRLIEYMNWVLDKPHRYVLFGGDMVDAATKLSIGSPWDNDKEPQGQLFDFCELVAPLRHRILGFVGGNHERRTVQTFGDSGMLIAHILRIPYSAGQQLIDIYYGDWAPFKIHLWHGRGAARTKGAKVMMAWKFITENPGSHLYLVGHLHDCFILPASATERKLGHNAIKMQKYFGGMSSSFLETWGTYAEVDGMSPTDVFMLRTVIEPGGKFEMTVR